MTPILHHFPLSPFSEKIRLILGATGTNWNEVILPVAPPRPSLDPVLGGYRRVPVMQVGAEFWCDSKLIAHELAQRLHRPEFSPFDRSADATDLMRRAEVDLFLPCFAAMPMLPTLCGYLRHLGLGGFARFLWDRAGLARDFHLPNPPRRTGQLAWRDWLEELDARLKHGWLEADGPTITVFHLLWFTNQLTGRNCTASRPNLTDWVARMSALSGKAQERLSPKESLEIARSVEIRRPPNLGKQVSITPSDYARVPTTGQLMEEARHSWTIFRASPTAGSVRIHFPKHGYTLEKAPS